MTPQKAIDRAKVAFMTRPNSVFLSTVLFNLQTSFSTAVPTAGTNGLQLYINPDFFISLTEEQRVGLLAHEVCHTIWNHMERGKNLDRQRYNIAADHIINLQLLDDNFQLPANGFWDKKYKGMSTRQVYDLLPPSPPPPPGAGGAGDTEASGDDDPTKGTGDIIYNEGPTDTGKEMTIENIVLKAITQADMAGNTPGSIPADVRRMVDHLINPVLPWQTILANYMSAYDKNDYSWRRPNKRFLPDFILPGQHNEKMGTLSAAIDLSGSVSKEQLKAFLSELSYIQQTMKPTKMNLISFDTKIHSNHMVTEGDDIMDFAMHGGGGTSLSWLNKYCKKVKPEVLIIFTDLEVNIPKDPKTDIIWIVIDNPTAEVPYGQIIHYDTRNL